jgi:signal transduction histidine kinase
VAVLRALGAQIAVSLENAALYEEAKRAIRLRDDFLTIASHELNTPVAALQLMAEGLEEGALGSIPAALERPLQLIVKQGRRLMSLIQDMLQIARFDRGPLELHRVELDLRAVVEKATRRLRDELAGAHCTLSVRASSAAPGHWDEELVERVVTHLLSNAIRFGPGKPIVVSVTADQSRVALEVSDSGIGIPPERLPHIFDRFERAVSVTHYGGLGLGLHIAQQIVLAHRGTIAVDSMVGVGTRVRVELPTS